MKPKSAPPQTSQQTQGPTTFSERYREGRCARDAEQTVQRLKNDQHGARDALNRAELQLRRRY